MQDVPVFSGHTLSVYSTSQEKKEVRYKHMLMEVLLMSCNKKKSISEMSNERTLLRY